MTAAATRDQRSGHAGARTVAAPPPATGHGCAAARLRAPETRDQVAAGCGGADERRGAKPDLRSPIQSPPSEGRRSSTKSWPWWPRRPAIRSDMLDLELDLEADLGIDTVKQAETFAAVRDAFDIPRRDDIKLRDYPTLKRVVDFVRESRPDLAEEPRTETRDQVTGQGMAAASASVAALKPVSGLGSQVTDKVLAIVADKTGYPSDMLDLELDMEADLGIDTVKQAETFAAIREAFDIPRRDDVKLRDYPTLKRVVDFVRESRPDLAGRDQRPETRDQRPETRCGGVRWPRRRASPAAPGSDLRSCSDLR